MRPPILIFFFLVVLVILVFTFSFLFYKEFLLANPMVCSIAFVSALFVGLFGMAHHIADILPTKK